MKQPKVVVTVTGGVAEVLLNETSEDVLILDFDWLDESGTKEEHAEVDRLIQTGKYNEASEYLADKEEELVNRELEEN